MKMRQSEDNIINESLIYIHKSQAKYYDGFFKLKFKIIKADYLRHKIINFKKILNKMNGP